MTEIGPPHIEERNQFVVETFVNLLKLSFLSTSE